MRGLRASGETGRAVLAWLVTLSLALGVMSFRAGAQDRPVQPVAQPPLTVGVFGDSLGDGLWIGVRRGLRGEPGVGEVLQLSEVSTGFANYVYRDIEEKTRDQLADHSIDIAIVLFGSNDIQGIRDGSAVHAFRSAGWEHVYRRRVRTFLAQLQQHGASVYWVGLPVMRSNGYDANTIYLNGIFRAEAEAAGARFIATRDASADASGAYAAYLPDAAGNPRLMRADDGIHFTLSGYTRIARPVVEAVRTHWQTPPDNAPLMAEAGPTAPAGTLASELLHLTLNGEAYLCTPAAPLVSAGTGAASRDSRR